MRGWSFNRYISCSPFLSAGAVLGTEDAKLRMGCSHRLWPQRESGKRHIEDTPEDRQDRMLWVFGGMGYCLYQRSFFLLLKGSISVWFAIIS